MESIDPTRVARFLREPHEWKLNPLIFIYEVIEVARFLREPHEWKLLSSLSDVDFDRWVARFLREPHEWKLVANCKGGNWRRLSQGSFGSRMNGNASGSGEIAGGAASVARFLREPHEWKQD